MSQVNDTNYVNRVPEAADYTVTVRNADGVIFTTTMQQLATLFASLASQNVTVTVISAEQTLSTQQMVEFNAPAPFNTLLPANALNTGRTYYLTNIGAGDVTILPDGSDVIGGGASITLAQWETATLRADGLGNWSRF